MTAVAAVLPLPLEQRRDEPEGRAAVVTALRRRLAHLGGVQGPGHPASAGYAPAVGDGWRIRSSRELVDREETVEQIARRAAEVGFELEDTPAGTAWVRRVSVDLAPFLERAGAPGPAGAASLVRLSCRLQPDVAVAPWADEAGAVCVLDVETLGLRGSGVIPFLVGIGVPEGTRLDIDQLLLADPGAERALLLAMQGRIGGRRLLLTYNGRTFDIPVLMARCIVNRVPDGGLDARLHCDLLAPVRRLFRDRLGACTLRQAEVGLLGFERVNDVTGGETPARYRQWLRGAGQRVFEGVVRHNQLDLCATAVLAARVVAHVEGALVAPVHMSDRYRLALHLDRMGVSDEAEQLLRQTYLAGRAPWDRVAGYRLAARVERRLRMDDEGHISQVDESLGIWQTLASRDPGDLRAARSLAIALERRGRIEEALAVCDRALAVVAGIAPWRLARMRRAPLGGWAEDWRRRRERLTRRLARRPPPHPRLLRPATP